MEIKNRKFRSESKMGHLEEKSDTSSAIIQFGANLLEDEDKKDGKQRKPSGVQQPTTFLCYDLQSLSPAIQVEIQ